MNVNKTRLEPEESRSWKKQFAAFASQKKEVLTMLKSMQFSKQSFSADPTTQGSGGLRSSPRSVAKQYGDLKRLMEEDRSFKLSAQEFEDLMNAKQTKEFLRLWTEAFGKEVSFETIKNANRVRWLNDDEVYEFADPEERSKTVIERKVLSMFVDEVEYQWSFDRIQQETRNTGEADFAWVLKKFEQEFLGAEARYDQPQERDAPHWHWSLFYYETSEDREQISASYDMEERTKEKAIGAQASFWKPVKGEIVVWNKSFNSISVLGEYLGQLDVMEAVQGNAYTSWKMRPFEKGAYEPAANGVTGFWDGDQASSVNQYKLPANSIEIEFSCIEDDEIEHLNLSRERNSIDPLLESDLLIFNAQEETFWVSLDKAHNPERLHSWYEAKRQRMTLSSELKQEPERSAVHDGKEPRIGVQPAAASEQVAVVKKRLRL